MELVVLVIHIFLALGIIGVVLLQPPESGALGGLGASNPMAGNAARGQGNILTRATAILATAFIITSLVLAIFAARQPVDRSILDSAIMETSAEAPVVETAPAVEPAPSVPLSE